jgi:peroxiredoxin
MAERLRLPFSVLSDSQFAFARAMPLPTFEVAGEVFLKRVTLLLSKGRVENVFCSVPAPEKNAEDVLRWLAATFPN